MVLELPRGIFVGVFFFVRVFLVGVFFLLGGFFFLLLAGLWKILCELGQTGAGQEHH